MLMCLCLLSHNMSFRGNFILCGMIFIFVFPWLLLIPATILILYISYKICKRICAFINKPKPSHETILKKEYKKLIDKKETELQARKEAEAITHKDRIGIGAIAVFLGIISFSSIYYDHYLHGIILGLFAISLVWVFWLSFGSRIQDRPSNLVTAIKIQKLAKQLGQTQAGCSVWNNIKNRE